VYVCIYFLASEKQLEVAEERLVEKENEMKQKLLEIETGKNKTVGDYERLGWEHEKVLKQNEELLLAKEKNEKTIERLEEQLNKLIDDNARIQRDGKDLSQSYESLKLKEEDEGGRLVTLAAENEKVKSDLSVATNKLTQQEEKVRLCIFFFFFLFFFFVFLIFFFFCFFLFFYINQLNTMLSATSRSSSTESKILLERISQGETQV
jgi:hypothetical protein